MQSPCLTLAPSPVRPHHHDACPNRSKYDREFFYAPMSFEHLTWQSRGDMDPLSVA